MSIKTAWAPSDGVGKWAVMRHVSKARQMHFASLHDDREEAAGEARRLATEVIGKYGAAADLCYYIVYLDAGVGIINGKLKDGSLSSMVCKPST